MRDAQATIEREEQPAEQEGEGKKQPRPKGGDHDEQSLNDMLQELRILQQGVQVLTAFLTILPFTDGFTKIDQVEKWIYLITYVCSIASLVLFSAPAAQHRLERPLMDRTRFKDLATRMIILSLVPFSVALVLVTQLVVSQVFGIVESVVVAALIAVVIAVFWWIFPLTRKKEQN
jgi:Ca2+/Na+ antiporter